MCVYDVYGPCSCPHGRCFTVLAQCFAVGGWISSVMALTSCFYIFVRPIPEEGEPELPREGFGYISRQVGVMEPPAYRQCAWYDRSDKETFFEGDGMWNAGKAMSVLAVSVGFVVMCLVLCTCCVAFELPTFDGLFWTCLLCFIAQALTFLSWGSELCDEYECTWSSGTGMNITAAMMWVWAANMVKSFPEALPPRGRRSGGKTRRPVEDDGEQTHYLNTNRNSEFQDEYEDEDGNAFRDWSDENEGDAQQQQYQNEEEPQGYYDDDGNWYEDDGSQQQQPSSYYSHEGEDPLEPSKYYNDDASHYEKDTDDPQPDLTDKGYAYKPNSNKHNSMSEEEMEFMAESQRTMNQID